jgi:hypothetical protein
MITPYMKRHALTAPASPVRGAIPNAAQDTDNIAPSFAEVLKRATQATMDAFQPKSANINTQNHEGRYPRFMKVAYSFINRIFFAPATTPTQCDSGWLR